MLIRLFRFLSIFPLPVLHNLGNLLGYFVYAVSASYRRRLRLNITAAGFHDQLGSAIREAGKNIMELPFVWCASDERLMRNVKVENWEVVQNALELGKGLIFLTPHLGCFELVGQAVAARTSITCLYRPPHKSALKPLLEGARTLKGIKLAPANLAGVRILAKALKRGETIGLLPDQVPQQGEGVWANFFGKPAYTMTLSAKLQNMSGAPIVLAFAERLAFGAGFVVHFTEFNQALIGTPSQQASLINQAMEQLIASQAAQYFWSYNRYKIPDGVAAPQSTPDQDVQ
ncbi:MAG: lysophospholipid acyltransferase family protein [Undibacterium sp.]|nr:lysophospholipid acyltransferase family protein [Undibacterium sp.]